MKHTNRLPERVRGKKYANLLRCSTLDQADTSPEQQKQGNDHAASEALMVGVGDIYGEGVSASKAFGRADIQEVLDLHARTPFDYLLVYDYSRFSRSGIGLTAELEGELLDHGIEVLSVNDPLPEDKDDADLIKSVRHYQNQKAARVTALAASRGLISSLKQGKRPASGMTPFGLDREYLGPDGVPRTITRWDGDEQLVLDPVTKEVRSRRRKPPRRKPGEKRKKQGGWNSYRRQPDETVRLIPGDQKRIETVIWMFEQYDLHKKGYDWICQELNRRGTGSPFGGRWCVTAVKRVLHQPAYFGIEIRNRQSNALHYELTDEGPRPVEVDQRKLKREGKKHVPIRNRPRRDWTIGEIPQLKEFLPEPVRSIAKKRVLDNLDKTAKNRDTHGEALKRNRNSPYLLAGHLREKTSGHTMRGQTTKRNNKSGPVTYRYYFDGSTHVYAQRGVQARRIRAEALEAEVAGAVANVLVQIPDLAERVRHHVREAASRRSSGPNDRDRLEAERDEVEEQFLLASQRKPAAQRAIAGQMAAWERRLEAIDAELSCQDEAEAAAELDPEAAASHVLSRLAAFRENPQKLPMAEAKEFFKAVVKAPIIDVRAMELTFEVVIPPTWMAVRPGCTGGSLSASWTNGPVGALSPLRLARIVSQQGPNRRKRPPTWTRMSLPIEMGDSACNASAALRPLGAHGDGQAKQAA